MNSAATRTLFAKSYNNNTTTSSANVSIEGTWNAARVTEIYCQYIRGMWNLEPTNEKPRHQTHTLLWSPTMIPHPPIPIADVRIKDIWILLGVGVGMEVLSRMVLWFVKFKSGQQVELEAKLVHLTKETVKKRRLGPSGFVETSKLERQVLALEKTLSKLVETRRTRTQKAERLGQRLSYVVYVVVFVLYFSIPVLTLDGMAVDFQNTSDGFGDERERANAYLQGFLFPLSYIGIGMRWARFGLPYPGIGALVVLWSSQATVGNLLDGVEAILLA